MEIIIVGGVLLLLLFILIGIYNRLVGLRQNVNQAEADIDAQLKLRHDLIPNLVETVKGYAAHEKSTLDAVIAARAKALAANNPAQAAEAEGALSASLRSLFALAENYPELKASANFQTLQNQLQDVEAMLAAARRAYNSVTADYNGAIEAFPAVLFARMLGFAKRPFQRLSETESAAMANPPAVKF